ncbi:hypothetical protein HAX54_027713 [Datura stramonium]|uniref:Uncharacterized protein n=1 Tax=Datura stramonium TaxID=4076 RepID=A0ABS8V318_DATST|nr:hypothetical protein [Datura stramonium]
MKANLVVGLGVRGKRKKRGEQREVGGLAVRWCCGCFRVVGRGGSTRNMREVWWRQSKGKKKREGRGLVVFRPTMAGINGGLGERENKGREEAAWWLWSFPEFDRSRREATDYDMGRG